LKSEEGLRLGSYEAKNLFDRINRIGWIKNGSWFSIHGLRLKKAEP